MKLEDIKKVGVVGAGMMGHGIALSFALWGYRTVLTDTNTATLNAARGRIKSALQIFVEEKVVTPKRADSAIKLITTTSDLAALARDADYVCEVIVERSQPKKELFNQLDALCPPHTILASNTSALLLSDFGSDVKRQDKIVVTHYFNPPHIVPCVEMVKGPGTSDETFNLTYDLLQKVKKSPVKLLKAIPGHLINRIIQATHREIYDLWAKGIASTEDIDLACKASFGFRLAGIGPLLVQDLGDWHNKGMLEATDRWFKQISNASEVPPRLRQQWEAHQGFFNIPKEKVPEMLEQRDRELLRCLKQLYWR